MIEIKNTTTGSTVPFKHLTFSGGEEHVTVNVDELYGDGRVEIIANIWSSKDVMTLLMVTDALYRDGCDIIDLVLKYVPYARQDRVSNPGESLSIKVFADLINAQKYASVEIWDPHSEVTTALLDRVIVKTQHELFTETVRGPTVGSNIAVLISPDAGALKKIYKLSEYYHTPVVVASKHRDTQTGQITGTTVDMPHAGDKDLWIVDDICDGGRTFTELAKVLRPLTDGRIMLYVTHGIFSQGFIPFEGLIDEIYCANVHPEHQATFRTSPPKLHFLNVSN